MDYQNDLVLIKNEDKTADIVSCHFTANQYHIRFVNNPRIYNYRPTYVQWLKNPTELLPNHCRFIYQGQTLYHINQILQFGDYLRFFFANGSIQTYPRQELTIEQNCLVGSSAGSCLDYFHQLAARTGLQTDDGQSYLLNQFTKMTYIGQDTALATYLNPHIATRQAARAPREAVYVYPFGHNLSQMTAIRTALTNQISVIEGPPGTGKTQTILNIVANIIIRGQTVAVVSNNNSATQNVLEKLDESGVSFIAAALGCSQNKAAFLQNQSGQYPDLSAYRFDAQLIRQARQDITQLESDLLTALQLKSQIAELRQQGSALALEQQYFNEYFRESSAMLRVGRSPIRLESAKLLRLSLACQATDPDHQLAGLLHRIKCWLTGQVKWSWLKHKQTNEFLPVFQYLYYIQKAAEIDHTILALESRLVNLDYESRMKNLKEQSLMVLQDCLYRKYDQRKPRPIFRTEDLWRNARAFNQEYPVITSTTHSIRASLNTDYLYEYVIVDEASQVDLVTGVLALSCAKNAVIVGDRMQLPNVVTSEIKPIAKALFYTYFLDAGYDYTEHSLLSSICAILPMAPRTLLREHYRCHPKIIGFCNQKFYQNQLIVLTEDDSRSDVLKVYTTVAGNHARGHVNQRQIDEIKKTVISELDNLVDLNQVGIISPYRDQTQALRDDEWMAQIDISTVHKFQGREKDAIIITTVDNEISPFADNPNLLNVAISRAKHYLRLVISDQDCRGSTNLGDLVRYIQYHNYATVPGSVYSVFDMLYKDYAAVRQKFLKDHRQISAYASENLMQALIDEVLQLDEFSRYDVVAHMPLQMIIRNRELLLPEELAYLRHAATHVDFLLFSRLDKRPVLVVEVDGVAFHTAASVQGQRDKLKNAILDKYGLPYLRFKTNGSQEKEKLIARLRQLSAPQGDCVTKSEGR